MTAIRGRLFRLLTSSSSSSSSSGGLCSNHIEINSSPSSKTPTTTTTTTTTTTASAQSSLTRGANSIANSSTIPRVVQEISLHEFLDEVITKKPLVILGEYHGSEPTIQLQTAIQEAMAHSLALQEEKAKSEGGSDERDRRGENPKVRVIMEHFSVDMDPLLQKFHLNGAMTTDELIGAYNDIGTEQHNLVPYKPLLESAKRYSANRNKNTIISLHGGFIPRNYARELHQITKKEQIAQQQSSSESLEPIKTLGDNSESVSLPSPSPSPLSQFRQKMVDLNYISPNETLLGTDEHYNYFESLFTQRNIHSQISYNNSGSQTTTTASKPKPQFRTLFPAQIIKDASMAWKVHSLLREANYNPSKKNNDKYFVISGVGHMLYSHGVPERILSLQRDFTSESCDRHHLQKEDMLRIACLPVPEGSNHNGHGDDIEKISSVIHDAYGNADAADFCFVYEDIDEFDNEEDFEIKPTTATPTALTNANEKHNHSIEQNVKNVKDDTTYTTKNDDYYIRQETKNVYDRVGSTAFKLEQGNFNKAHSILKSLHYSDEDISYIGLDAVNYQGVGNPHLHAKIQHGEKVLDLGSGLGVDSMIAAKAAGEKGLVVGIDLSAECVHHAIRRSKERGIESTLSFIHSPIESIGSKIDESFQSESEDASAGSISSMMLFDVIISNGAFCLLPDKAKGFRECYRLLKPGGRIAICTTVIKSDLEDGVEWPLCMQTFASMDELKPILEGVGFEDIVIDLSDSLMEVEVDEEEMEVLGREESEEGENDLSNNNEAKGVSDDQDDNNQDDNNQDDKNGRYKVHNEDGRKRFKHLDSFDMNKLCARVVIKARKPTE